MMDDGGGFFWVVMAVLGVALLGGSIALSLVRRRELTPEERAAQETGTRRLYADEARDAAR